MTGFLERLGLRSDLSQQPEDSETNPESAFRPEAPSDERAGLSSTPAEVGSDGAPNEEPEASATATAETDMRAALHVAERERDALRRETEIEAARITEDARRQAQELLDNAALEAKGIIVLAGQERARRESEVEHEQERLALEERRARLESLATVHEAQRRADELLEAAEQQRAGLVRDAEAEAERKAAEIIEDAERRARERFEEAELEAKGIVVETGRERSRLLSELAHELARLEETRTRLDSLTAIEEAAQKAEELLVAAEQRRENLRRESEDEAKRQAAEITEEAQRRARGLLEEAERDAARIVDAAGRERARLIDELARQRSVFEETRTSLAGFLSGVLDEVERAPAGSSRT